MPWKIVNLDYACDRPHLHIKDPNAPIHLRSYFDERRIEIGLGGDEPDACFVRATVSSDAVAVHATKFEPLHVQILQSILASLDVEPEERDEALAWMRDRLRAHDGGGFVQGDVAAFPPPTGWPYDLTDDALLDSIRDSENMPSTRSRALRAEARRRGMRVEAPRRPAEGGRAEPRPAPREPEVFRRR